MKDKKQTIKKPSEVPRKTGPLGALIFVAIVFVAGCFVGTYLEPIRIRLFDEVRFRITGTARAADQATGNPLNPELIRENPTPEHIEAVILSLGEMRKGIKEQIEAMKDKVQLEQNSLTVSIVVEGSDPNSAECKILRKRISNLKDQLKTLESLDKSLVKQDMKLRKLYAVVKTDGDRINKDPNMLNTLKLSENLITDYAEKKELEQLDKRLREGLISTKDWEKEIRQGGS
jgi:hypothetical protein